MKKIYGVSMLRRQSGFGTVKVFEVSISWVPCQICFLTPPPSALSNRWDRFHPIVLRRNPIYITTVSAPHQWCYWSFSDFGDPPLQWLSSCYGTLSISVLSMSSCPGSPGVSCLTFDKVVSSMTCLTCLSSWTWPLLIPVSKLCCLSALPRRGFCFVLFVFFFPNFTEK